MATGKDYLGEAFEAACSVMIELVHLLDGYRHRPVAIGGRDPDLPPPGPGSVSAPMPRAGSNVG
ncbi:MAG: hypothetical protein M1398_03320 [Deltaproteobacteria bacterium]|nr:hypothetical protein [Deltaproteobacteria bacterium]MDA8306090.1 hypothetical protein [Deltaproteobacteria bacterium]